MIAEEPQRCRVTAIPMTSPSCLSFRASAEESQRCGENQPSYAQSPQPVIPSDSRGTPTVRGEPTFLLPIPTASHSERQPRNPNGAGRTNLPTPNPHSQSFRATAEESQRCGENQPSYPQSPQPVIPSDSRGIPTVRGQGTFLPPIPTASDSERQPRNPNGAGTRNLPTPNPHSQ